MSPTKSPRSQGRTTPTLASAPEYAFVGRQPVFDARLDVFAYELLFRRGEGAQAQVDDADVATAAVFCNTFMDIGFDTVVGNKMALVNASRTFLLGPWPLVLPPHRVILEVLETVEPDHEVLERLAALSSAGYQIALDDFVYAPHRRPMVELADIVKVDLRALTRDQVAEHVDTISALGALVLGEKIETAEEFEFCRSLGMTYFQGYVLKRPQVVRRQRIAQNRSVTLDVLRRVSAPDVTLDELGAIIGRDVALSYALLRCTNSARLALPVPVESLDHALRLLGLAQVRVWVSLLVLSQVSDKPTEVLVTALLRARMSRGLAALDPTIDSPAQAFTVGLFSALDVLLDEPLSELVPSLGLAAPIEAALLHREGPLGQLLLLVLAYEEGDWNRVSNGTKFTPRQLREAWLAGLESLVDLRELLDRSSCPGQIERPRT